MAAILYHRVLGDLTVGKPKLKEFPQSASVREALETLLERNEFELPVWKMSRRQSMERFGNSGEKYERPQAKEERFIGMLSILDILGHLSTEQSLLDPIWALNVPVSDIVTSIPVLLRHAAPGTRLIDVLELIKSGTSQLLVPLGSGFQRVSKRFSAYHSSSRWLPAAPDIEVVPKPEKPYGYCILTVEDVARFLLGCLGALAPFPLKRIDSQGIINTSPPMIFGSDPARLGLKIREEAPDSIQAVAVVENFEDGNGICKPILIGEISAIKLRNSGLRVAFALATLSAKDFVGYVEHFGDSKGSSGAGKFWTEGISFSLVNYQMQHRGKGDFPNVPSRIMPLTCRPSNSVAAVMAQMLAYRTTHVWVTDEIGTLLGMVTFKDIITAISTLSTSVEQLVSSMISSPDLLEVYGYV
ncbi:hypothetical protein Mapa_013117 [Marchantia paleacea]|nr:hypothetical protein Mapa_013117 [Marchantia paleacea]